MKRIQLFYTVLFILSIFQPSQTLENGNVNETKDGDASKSSRKYKGLVLENGLKVILIHDPDTLIAAGSLHVGAGSMSNPKEIPGLAHLLEHMIFNGNKKYPEPEAFYKYVSKNGGGHYAATGQDYTEYKFSVYPNALRGALNHLFHMINSPLLLESCVRDEIAVVHSEYVRNVPQDNSRYYQVERATSLKGHPYNNFPTGNEETLWTKPKQLGINIGKELKTFHEEYYSSNIMTLAILGNNSFKVLEEMVTGTFGKLRNRNTSLPNWPESPFGPSELGVKIEIIPKGGLQYLSLEFPIPEEAYYVFDNYYVSLISRGENQSLFKLLKSANLVSNLYVGVTSRYRGFYLFYISFQLTDLGLIHHDQVVVHVFEFMNFLRNHPPQEWFWDEVKEIEDITERFTIQDGASTLVSTLGKYMLETTPEETINEYSTNFTRIDFNATEIVDVLHYVIPENMRLYVVSNLIRNTTLVEPNYEIDYSFRPIDPAFLMSLKMAVPNPRVQFPTKNDYLPTNFEIKDSPIDNTDFFPKVVKTTEFSRIWFLQDNFYLVPKAIIRTKLFNPVAYVTPLDSGLNSILNYVIYDALLPMTVSASVAETEVTVGAVSVGLEMAIVGYNDRIDRVLYKVMETITSLSFTNESFHVAKEFYRKSIRDAQNAQPCTLADTNILLTETYWTLQQLDGALNDIRLEDLELYYQRFISRVKLEWLIYGNVLEEEAIQMVKKSEEFFANKGSRPGMDAEYKWQIRNVQIPKGTNWLIRINTTKHSSTCSRVAFQTSKPGLSDSVKITFLANLMKQPAYVQLRTREQLGYDLSVYSSPDIGYSSNTLQIYVQGERDPGFVEGRINRFLLKFRDILRNMTEREFQERKLVQWQKWDTISSVMESHGFSFWKEIYYGHYNFDRDVYKQAFLNLLKLPELLKFYDELIGFGTGEQRRLSIYVVPANKNTSENTMVVTKAPLQETTTVVDIMDTTLNSESLGYNTSTDIPNREMLNGTTTSSPLFFEKLTETHNKSASSVNLDVNNNLDSGSREGKTLKQLNADFMDQTAVVISDFVAWKRKQYLYPTPGIRNMK